MVIVTCERPFRDLRAGVDREPGDSWAEEETRADQIAAKFPGFVTLQPAPEAEPKPAAKPSHKRPAAKARAGKD